MQYNLYLLDAAVVICLLLLAHALFTWRTFKGLLPAIVYGCIALVLVDSLADIVASLCIMHAQQCSLFVLYASDMVLYIDMALLAFVMFIYCIALCGMLRKEKLRFILGSSTICIFVIALIAVTPLTGLVFSFDAQTHAYSYGPLRTCVYIEGTVYGLCALALVVREHKYLRNLDLFAAFVVVFLSFIAAIAQAFFTEIAMVGFFAALDCMFIYLALINPKGLGDPVTGLFDTGEFKRRIMSLAHRGERFDLIILGITNRRYLTGVLGSDATTELLQRCASALMHISSSKQVYKLNGSRFVMISYDDATTDRYVTAATNWVNRPHLLGDIRVELDGGLISVRDAGTICTQTDVEDFFEFALERAIKGNDNFIAQSQLQSSYAEFTTALSALDAALEHKKTNLFVQPIISVRGGKAFTSCEVLSRLKDENDNYVSPGIFIPIAEETGSIVQLSKMQFVHLCEFLAENRESLERLGLNDVKYNLSAVEFTDTQLAPALLSCIKRYGLSPALFSFELTESATTGNDSVLKTFNALHEAGCRLYLDDFGSGYANLSILNHIPFDGVKMDITLLDGVLEDKAAASFYQGTVELMHRLNKCVVSEGVELEEQAELLASWGVDNLQGFYYAKPMPLQDVIPFLERAAQA